MKLRRVLYARGLRYRVDYSPIPTSRCRADIAFVKQRLAVFVDGCFWHSCPEHGTTPKANGDWWREKLGRNVQRDQAINEHLSQAGWTVVRIWEHEATEIGSQKVITALEAISAMRSQPS